MRNLPETGEHIDTERLFSHVSFPPQQLLRLCGVLFLPVRRTVQRRRCTDPLQRCRRLPPAAAEATLTAAA